MSEDVRRVQRRWQWATYEGALPQACHWLGERSNEGYTLVSHTTVVRRLWRDAEKGNELQSGESSSHAIIMRREVEVAVPVDA